MNIHNVNNLPNPAEPIGRNQEVPNRTVNERVGRVEETEEAQQALPGNEVNEQGAIRPAQDMFQPTEERELVNELTRIIENTEETPREDLVARAQERVQEGYYNRREFEGNLAIRLINTEHVL